MKRVPSVIWAGLLFALLYVFFEYGIAPLTGALTDTTAPLPSSLVLMYTGMAALAILLYCSVQEEKWQPRPANFRDTGTIAQLDENYVFWRIKEGGPGVPKGSIEYRSSMPIWDGVLSDEEIWKIIMFEYTNAGVKPAKRAME